MSKRRKRKSWSDDEKREICEQTVPRGVSVAQVERCYAMNANMIHNWLKDPRFAPPAVAPGAAVVDPPFIELAMQSPDLPVAVDPLLATRVDIALSGGRRVLIDRKTACLFYRHASEGSACILIA